MKSLPANLRPLTLADLIEMRGEYQIAQAEYFYAGNEAAARKANKNMQMINKELNRRIDAKDRKEVGNEPS